VTNSPQHVSRGYRWYLASGVIPGRNCPHLDCVEFAADGAEVLISDTKVREEHILRVPRHIAAEFLADIKNGHYDGNGYITTGELNVELRDSPNRRAVLFMFPSFDRTRLVFDRAEWLVFTGGVKSGEFDHLVMAEDAYA